MVWVVVVVAHSMEYRHRIAVARELLAIVRQVVVARIPVFVPAHVAHADRVYRTVGRNRHTTDIGEETVLPAELRQILALTIGDMVVGRGDEHEPRVVDGREREVVLLVSVDRGREPAKELRDHIRRTLDLVARRDRDEQMSAALIGLHRITSVGVGQNAQIAVRDHYALNRPPLGVAYASRKVVALLLSAHNDA